MDLPPSTPQPTPPRIRAALRHTRLVFFARRRTPFSGPPRRVTPEENATHLAALLLLRQYLEGQLEFDAPSPGPITPRP